MNEEGIIDFVKTEIIDECDDSFHNSPGETCFQVKCEDEEIRINPTSPLRKSIKKQKRAGGKQMRKVISLQEKLEIIKKYECGQRKVKIGREHKLAEATIRSILKNANDYKEKGKAASSSCMGTTRNQSLTMIELERLLSIWIEDCNQKQVLLSTDLIKSKALSLFSELKAKAIKDGKEENETFSASSGWFKRFKKRTNINKVRITGEVTLTDKEAAAKYPDILKKIVEDGGYSDQQIFNVDETVLFWKRMPSKTFLAIREKSLPGYKPANDRMMLLLGGNATGDLKLKPMLIYHSQNPRALRGIRPESLPVIWKFSQKGLVTKALYEEWFLDHFCPTVEKFCKQNNLNFKALLILNRSPSHPASLNSICENIKVVFLPPNTTSLLQPIDQRTIATFKAYYLRRIFKQAIQRISGVNAITLVEFWKNYNIKDSIENIHQSWLEITASHMRDEWKRILPHCANDFKDFSNEMENVVQEISQLGKEFNFNNMDSKNVQDYINAQSEELTNDDLLNLDSERAFESDNDDGGGDNSEETSIPVHLKEITQQEFEAMFKTIEVLKQQCIDADPDRKRSYQVCQKVEAAMQPYRQLFKKQKNIPNFTK